MSSSPAWTSGPSSAHFAPASLTQSWASGNLFIYVSFSSLSTSPCAAFESRGPIPASAYQAFVRPSRSGRRGVAATLHPAPPGVFNVPGASLYHTIPHLMSFGSHVRASLRGL
ncbi:hypothetical protein C8R44DRAFT_855331 [Mycena epipterygia]|nr:hypothetical protein C8R44DRAFT_855331 [Mycena epipterygia]